MKTTKGRCLPKLSFHRVSCLAALASFLPAMAAQAQIIANFSGGTGTSSADQYAGQAGSGWASAWYTVNTAGTGSSTAIAASVANTSALNGGGNYLSVTNSNTLANNSAGDSVGRDISSANGVSLASAYTIKFDFRLDSPAAELGSNDGLNFFNDSSSTKVLGGGNGFQVVGSLASSLVQWRLRNGGAFINTGMQITTGTVYSFTLDLNPASYQYVVSINNGSTTFTSGTLGYRNTSASPSTFNHLLFNSKDFAGTQTITYSLDNIAVTAVPEPASGVLLLVGCAALFFIRRRGKTGLPPGC
jgi:hypothetical protein